MKNFAILALLAACGGPAASITTTTATATGTCECPDPVTVFEQGGLRVVETLGDPVDTGCYLADLGEGEMLVSVQTQDAAGKWLTANDNGFPIYQLGGAVMHDTAFGCEPFAAYRVWIATPQGE